MPPYFCWLRFLLSLQHQPPNLGPKSIQIDNDKRGPLIILCPLSYTIGEERKRGSGAGARRAASGKRTRSSSKGAGSSRGRLHGGLWVRLPRSSRRLGEEAPRLVDAVSSFTATPRGRGRGSRCRRWRRCPRRCPHRIRVSAAVAVAGRARRAVGAVGKSRRLTHRRDVAHGEKVHRAGGGGATPAWVP